MTEEEMAKYELLTSRIVSGFGTIPPGIIRDYIAYNEEIEKGLHDAAFMKAFTIEQITSVKLKVKFLADMGQVFLDTRPRIEKYMIDSGQMPKEKVNASNDNSGTIRGS